VDWSPEKAGETWATWVAEKLNGTGKVAYLGGPAGNPVSVGTLKGINTVLAKNPGIQLLTGSDTVPATNWDPAQAQNIMASLIAKEPQIDAVITDDGSSGQGALRAFTSAGRTLPIMATLESNALGCAYSEATATNPTLQVATISARNWLGRIAARKAVAAAEGLPETDPSSFDLPLYEDSSAGNPPKCDTSVSPETFFSNQLTPADISTYGKAS
jgi:ribose transport system substrate-binding protein